MKPISPDIHQLIESDQVEFRFCQEARGRNKSSGRRKWFQGRSALDEAAGIKFSDQLYHRLIEASQTLIEQLPIENNPRDEWHDVHKKCRDLIAALEKVEIKHELIGRLEKESVEAEQIANSISPNVPILKMGRPTKLNAATENFIAAVLSIWRDAGGTGYGSWSAKSTTCGKRVYRGQMQELITVVFSALRLLGAPVVIDGDTDPYFTKEVKGTISRASIHSLLMRISRN